MVNMRSIHIQIFAFSIDEFQIRMKYGFVRYQANVEMPTWMCDEIEIKLQITLF